MNILFIHGNFPGQFKHLASSLALQETNKVVFLTNRLKEDCPKLERIHIHNYSLHRNSGEGTHHYLRATEDAILKGQAVVREIDKLKSDGFEPRLVILHGGMGLGLFLKDVLPNCKVVGLYEWYFTSKTQGWATGSWDINTQLMANARNLPITQELMNCDGAIVPTKWQKRQFPHSVQDNLNCIFDGIDTTFFRPDQSARDNRLSIKCENQEQPLVIEPGIPILTYMTRGMEPLRGFPEFMKMLPHLLKENENLHVIIAGRDGAAYSYPAPTKNGSWKEHMLEILGDFEGRDRIFFTGLLSYQDYVKVLQRTDLHCYFTRPYVTSWSLLEAAACGAPLILSDNEATRDLLENQEAACWINLDSNPNLIAKMLNAHLKNNMSKNREPNIKNEFKLTECMAKWEKALNKALH